MPDLQDLADQLARSNLRNVDVQNLVHDQLLGMRSRLKTSDENLIGPVDAAATLVRSLDALDVETGDEVRNLIVKLVSLVSDACGRRGIPSQVGTPQATPSSVTNAGLSTLNDMALGDVMVQLGLVTQDQVDTALIEMTRSGRPLGETLIQIGASTAEDVQRGLNLQHLLSKADPSKSSAGQRPPASETIHAILLGEILVRMGRITHPQLEQALRLQQEDGMRVGEALVELGMVTWADVAEAVRVQDMRGGSSERNADETIVRLDD